MDGVLKNKSSSKYNAQLDALNIDRKRMYLCVCVMITVQRQTHSPDEFQIPIIYRKWL